MPGDLRGDSTEHGDYIRETIFYYYHAKVTQSTAGIRTYVESSMVIYTYKP